MAKRLIDLDDEIGRRGRAAAIPDGNRPFGSASTEVWPNLSKLLSKITPPVVRTPGLTERSTFWIDWPGANFDPFPTSFNAFSIRRRDNSTARIANSNRSAMLWHHTGAPNDVIAIQMHDFIPVFMGNQVEWMGPWLPNLTGENPLDATVLCQVHLTDDSGIYGHALSAEWSWTPPPEGNLDRYRAVYSNYTSVGDLEFQAYDTIRSLP